MSANNTAEPCQYCGGVEREPTNAETFLGAVMKTMPSVTVQQLAELGARLGCKARIIWTEMTDDEKAKAKRDLAGQASEP